MKLYTTLITIKAPPPPPILHRPSKSFISLSSTTTTESTHRATLAESLQSETLKTLEWPSVCNQVSAFTSTPMGFSVAHNGRLPLGRSPEESRKLLAQTAAAVALPRPLDLSGIEDVTEIIDSSVAGELLSISELCSVKRTLKSARALLGKLEELSLDDDSSES